MTKWDKTKLRNREAYDTAVLLGAEQQLAVAVKLLRRVLNAYSHGTSTLLPEIDEFVKTYDRRHL